MPVKGTWSVGDSAVLKYGFLSHINSLRLELKDPSRVRLWTQVNLDFNSPSIISCNFFWQFPEFFLAPFSLPKGYSCGE